MKQSTSFIQKFARNSLNLYHFLFARDSLNIVFICLSENSQELLWITFIKFITIYLYLQSFIMTCDFESVEFQTTRLLKSTANRQVFLLSFDASAESQNVAISWNIKIEEQLRQWVLDQLNEIIKMLDELKDQQDMTLKCNEHWIILQVEHTQRLKQLKINCMTMNTLEEINT